MLLVKVPKREASTVVCKRSLTLFDSSSCFRLIFFVLSFELSTDCLGLDCLVSFVPVDFVNKVKQFS